MRADDFHAVFGRDNAGDVVRRLDEPSDFLVLTHRENTIVGGLHHLHEARAHVLRKNRLCIGTFHRKFHRPFRHVVFFLDLRRENVPIGLHLVFFVGGNGENGHTVARNRVVQLTRVELGEAQSVAFLRLIEEASHRLHGIGAFLLDVATRVAAHEALQRGLHEEPTLRCFLALEVERGRRRPTACATDENLAFVLRIEVDEHIARHKAGLHTLGTRQSGLFVTRENALERSVFNVVAVENRQLDGTADTVVGTERRALRAKPFAIDVSLNGILVEVEFHINQFLADHIHVALQNHRRAVFQALRGRLADDDVARLIDFCFQPTAFAEILQKRNHFLLALRGARNLVDACELLKHAYWFQFDLVHDQ